MLVFGSVVSLYLLKYFWLRQKFPKALRKALEESLALYQHCNASWDGKLLDDIFVLEISSGQPALLIPLGKMPETGMSSRGLRCNLLHLAAGDPDTECISTDVEVYAMSSRMWNYICNCFLFCVKLFITVIICHTSHWSWCITIIPSHHY